VFNGRETILPILLKGFPGALDRAAAGRLQGALD
jgi:hypothetical protein